MAHKLKNQWTFWTLEESNKDGVFVPLVIPSLTGPKVSTTFIDSIEQFWESFSCLKPIDELMPGGQIGFFKRDYRPIGKNQWLGGRWVCHLNDVKDLGIIPRIVWESLLLKLISGNWIKDNTDERVEYNSIGHHYHHHHNAKFLASGLQLGDQQNIKIGFKNRQLNDFILSDITGIVIERRDDQGGFILSIWNVHDSFLENCLKIPKCSGLSGKERQLIHDKLLDYELNRYEKLNQFSLELYSKVGITCFGYRRKIWDEFENIVKELKALLILNRDKLKGVHIEEIELIYKVRYIFHCKRGVQSVPGNKNGKGNLNGKNKYNNNTHEDKIEYLEDGLVVQELA